METMTNQQLVLVMGKGGNNATMNTSGHDEDVVAGFKKYISDDDFTYIIISIMTVSNCSIGMVGIVTNILNIIVFIKQGVFSDSSTVSLFALAVADLVSVASTVWIGITFCVAVMEPPGLFWSPFDIMYMTGSWPHIVSGLIARMITALIGMERCFCVVFPFKVKNVFTTRCSSITIFIIYAYILLCYSSVYILNTFHMITDPKTNTTRLVLIEHRDWQYVQLVTGYGNLYALNFLSVVIVLICTTVTISRVKLSMAWRDSMGTSNQGKKGKNAKENKSESETEQPKNKMSSSKMQNEKKLIRMITVISVLFLICYIPSIGPIVQYSYDREIRTDGLYRNVAWTVYSVAWGSESLNSSINIFIYYRMSSKFRAAFNTVFGISEA